MPHSPAGSKRKRVEAFVLGDHLWGECSSLRLREPAVLLHGLVEVLDAVVEGTPCTPAAPVAHDKLQGGRWFQQGYWWGRVGGVGVGDLWAELSGMEDIVDAEVCWEFEAVGEGTQVFHDTEGTQPA